MGRQTVDDAGMHEDYGSEYALPDPLASLCLLMILPASDPNAEVNFALLEASDSDGGG